MNEFDITLRIQTNSSRKVDIGQAIVNALLRTDIVVNVVDIDIKTRTNDAPVASSVEGDRPNG